ncbi:NUDIX hydrolase [Pseudomonas gingeri]|uniref:NUDIX hydrolase n=1 Tax=Pseudomonas gingeri TaxID=117681 RepID=UPI0015A1AE55|nr:NUDIX hydrolase [Pseudomonas gingeri]NWE25936.1 NUDIX hydrolase [Pseudomonas gingeri]NWE96209.1 NUDIX hydrolase [Pseudomonas gingeri]
MKPDTESECLLHTPYFDVVKQRGYFIVKEPQAVNGVVAAPVLPDGRLMLAVLQRRAIGAQSIEFPRGAIDHGETASDAAARELLEETGWPALKVTELGLLHSNTSLIASAVAVCRVDIDGAAVEGTDGEVDKVLFVTLAELKTMIAAGQITDGHTLSATMMLIAHAENEPL